MPIRARLTLWYALLLAAIIAGLGTFLVFQLRADLLKVIDRELHGSVLEVAREYEEEVTDEQSLTGAAADFRDICETAGEGRAAQLLSADGRVLFTCGEPGRPAPAVPLDVRRAAIAGTPRVLSVAATRGADRWRARLARVSGLRGEPGAVVVAESLAEVDGAVDRVLVLLLLAGPAALALTALGGWWLARKALSPVERMTSRAREIRIDRLHERVPVPRASDELQNLGTTLNTMLDRLERGVAEKQRLVADASHELRTPLTVMRAELDVSLRGDDVPDGAREVLESAREEVDRLTRTVDNLLTLAQVDAGRLELLPSGVDLREAIEVPARRLRPLAGNKRVRLVVAGPPCCAPADPYRLQQAITNLIENAVKFARPGGEVRVTTGSPTGRTRWG